jgi:hypothetical protein
MQEGTGASDMATRVRGGLVELTDELLDYLAERFVFYRVRDFLGITFGDFLANPEYYVRKTCEMVRAVLEIEYRPQSVSWEDTRAFGFSFAEGGYA